MKLIPIHPLSVKSLRNGHPWITKDKFSDAFPKNEELLELQDPTNNGSFGSFIHDPDHPKIKARFWAKESRDFAQDLEKRMSESFEKRDLYLQERENIYLAFGESDLLPGLFIQKLGDTVLIQYQAFFWKKHLKKITKFLIQKKYSKLWIQARLPGDKKVSPQAQNERLKDQLTLKENSLKMIVKFKEGHDIGVYTDMAAIRKKIDPKFKGRSSLLNLFSYTGAFSLQGLKHGLEVTSVDLSKKYMNWLEENLDINQFDRPIHKSVISAADKFVQKCTEKFDLIICDPPSFYSNKKKRESSLDFYKKNINQLVELLENQGELIIFINTHSLSKAKFKKTLEPIMETGKIRADLAMSEDCKALHSFPEGNYIKGLIITKK